MPQKHIWIIHTKKDPDNRSKTSGWTPMFKETSAPKAQARVDQLTDIKKTAQLKVSKHLITPDGYDPNPLSETLVGRFERTAKPAPATKPKPVKPKNNLEKMMLNPKPHAKRATSKTKPKGGK